MTSSPNAMAAWLARREADRAALLIHGGDVMRVASSRQQVVGRLIGPDGDAEMRLARIPAGDLRGAPSLLTDAMRAQGFFPGPRVVLVEEATQWSAGALGDALNDWRAGDAMIVVTAGNLKPTSPVRKLFEKHPRAAVVEIRATAPTPAEIEAELAAAGLPAPGRDGKEALVALAQLLEPGDFRQTLEKIALYKLGDDDPLSAGDVAACAPVSTEAALDDMLDIVAEGRTGAIGPLMSRLQAQGVTAVSLCIGLTRHFRLLHGAAVSPGRRVFHPRSDALVRQARGWSVARLEQALTMILDTDLALRSSSRAPAMALVERTLIRVSMLGRR